MVALKFSFQTFVQARPRQFALKSFKQKIPLRRRDRVRETEIGRVIQGVRRANPLSACFRGIPNRRHIYCFVPHSHLVSLLNSGDTVPYGTPTPTFCKTPLCPPTPPPPPPPPRIVVIYHVLQQQQFHT